MTVTAEDIVAGIRVAREPPAALPTVDLAALALAGVPDPVRICDGLLYLGHLHQLIGAPEAGKSTVGAAWVLDELRGDGRVVWLDEEAGPEQMVEKLLALGATPGMLAPARLAYVPFPGRTWGAPDVAALDDLMTAVRPTLVVVDSVSAFASAAGLNDSDNTDTSRIYKTVYLRMARQHGAAVVVLDHLTKSDEGGRFARGAGSKLGLVDVSWRLDVVKPFDRANDGLLKLTIGKDRRGYLHRAHEVRVTTGGGLSVTVTAVTAGTDAAGGAKRPPAAQKLLDALTARDAPSTIAQLVDLVVEKHGHGLKRETCSRHLNQLAKEGVVESLSGDLWGEKVWRLTTPDEGVTA
ncbi:AAA family ATPase [Frankia gtarii]|uniref:AAA family ATPase n=1 Tax=Frankia gtarii TaxID=2950102 RepID=UPI0021C1E81E|nr:AAA family ATPase [Frankia gtarii]